MARASRMAVIMRFNKCKLMIQAHSLDVSIESLHADLSDESLIAVMNDGIGIIVEITKTLTHKIEVDVAPQIRIIQAGEVDDDGIGLALCIIEGHSEASTDPYTSP